MLCYANNLTFRKLLRPIPEEVLLENSLPEVTEPIPEEVFPENTFGSTSSGMGLNNFRKKVFRKLPIPEAVLPEVFSGRTSSGIGLSA